MRTSALVLGLILLPALPGAAAVVYDRPINIITSNYDLVDTTYIDRGRLDGVKIGDKFKVNFRDGKLATEVVVTGVFERMASVKIVDSWLLKDGQLANYEQRPMVVALEPNSRGSVSGRPYLSGGPAVAPSAPGAPSPAPSGLPPAPAVGMPPPPGVAPDAGMPPAPGVAPDAGMPPAPGVNTGLAGGMPAGPGAPDAGMPPAPGVNPGLAGGMPAGPGAPDAGLPPAPGGAPDAGLPPAPGVAPDAGLPPAPGGAPDAGLPP
ncbi:MAG TPA: hypothetical protein VK786_01040, partial [bacterium]|nr:hypothetical protein [bacterium]